MVRDLLLICDILGVLYDRNRVDSLEKCEAIQYLINRIYLFLGGSGA